MEGSRNNNFSNRFKNKTHVVGKEGLSSLLKEGDSVVPSRGSYPKI